MKQSVQERMESFRKEVLHLVKKEINKLLIDTNCEVYKLPSPQYVTLHLEEQDGSYIVPVQLSSITEDTIRYIYPMTLDEDKKGEETEIQLDFLSLDELYNLSSTIGL